MRRKGGNLGIHMGGVQGLAAGGERKLAGGDGYWERKERGRHG